MIEFAFAKTLAGSDGEFELDVKGRIGFGERVSLFGKSGVGKSTILRVLAGLSGIDQGRVVVDGEVWNDGVLILPPQKRKIGFVFQDYALFPNLNVMQNIAYSKNANPKRVNQLIEMMGLGGIAMHKPAKLSGGQSQRVALARALASEPKILLLDEPFSALDDEIKNHLICEVNLLQKEFGFVMIVVSHSISEVYRLSDKVMCLENGRIAKITTPKHRFLHNNICLDGEVLAIEYFSITAQIQVLVGSEVLSFVCNRGELENVQEGSKVRMTFKAFSPMLEKLD
ncbi:hypothetical protein BBW65_01930 [Helicobacter enhydrae]|uniref:ABC transporter domain-containing protein n=1 Tax=Helicobacter enhydrae TaxID=222136 RepID=A0A1B1U4F2_9HELI|nr:ATP-binding cassette domain-containing protein [Helicobacter enhydrae]ANV97640.1 hypothetical protein BBW65_01930 [Helicobacter enhydrae]